MCVGRGNVYASVGVQRDQRCDQALVSCELPDKVLGTKLESSARSVHTPALLSPSLLELAL